MKHRILLLVVCFSSVIHSLWATVPTEPFFHKNIQVLTQHMEIQLLSIEEIKYNVTYTFLVESEQIDTLFVYQQHRIPSDVQAFPNETMKIAVDKQLIDLIKIKKNAICEEKWKAFDEDYNTYLRDDDDDDNFIYCLPVALWKGKHTLNIQFKAEPEDVYGYPTWNKYSFAYFYNHLVNSHIPYGNIEVDILLKDKKGIWTYNDETITGDIKETWEQDQYTSYFNLYAEMPKPFWVKMIERITPFRLFLIWAIILLNIHILLIYRYRVLHPTNKFSKVAWIGGILLPFFQIFLTPILFSFSYNLLAKYVSYHLEDWLLYNLLIGSALWVILYLPFSLLADYIFKRILQKRTQTIQEKV